MRVKRDFDQIYADEDDPWGIGAADSDRYDLYVDRILTESRQRGSILELGCGFGALLARLSDGFDRAVGVDVSATAVQRARQRFPSITFEHGSLADPEAALPAVGTFDTIVVSDVLYYLKERDRRRAVAWISRHLAPGGLAFLAGWSPGGRYLAIDEFRNLVARELAIESEQVLETQHVLFFARPRRTLVALTVDYETWQPQLEGVALDWDVDVLKPTRRLLDVFDGGGATLTIFAEMGEYLWLAENRPETARLIEEQLREATRRGHDVQLHLHPNWLPEMGPTVAEGKWQWDMKRSRAADYPGDLTEAIRRCKSALEDAIRPVLPEYAVTAYRAGTYEAQPFDRLHAALTANGIDCDSSVLPGDSRPDRHYDYAHAHSDHQPWFAARYDPQLSAPPAERTIVELPVFTPSRGERWTFDNEQGGQFARKLLARLAAERNRPSSEQLRRRRRRRELVNGLYLRTPPEARRLLNRWMPRRLAIYASGYEPARSIGNDYYVLVAHTKTALDYAAIEAGLKSLLTEREVELVSLSEMATVARAELEQRTSAATDRPPDSSRYPMIARPRLKAMIPLDRRLVVELATGLGDLALSDGGSDAVVADGILDRAFDVDTTLTSILAGLTDGGCLICALRPDGLNPLYSDGGQRWSTIASDLAVRLGAAGFSDLEVETVDTFRELGAPPYPPSNDQMLYVRAWKRPPGFAPLDRVRELTRWAYDSLSPDRPQDSNDPIAILAGGHAWCWGYVLVLGEALFRERYEVRWVTMIAEGHPLGVGPRKRDSHEVLEVSLPDGRRVVCDPMVGVVFEASMAELLNDPSLADVSRPEDERYRARNYSLYSTSSWYGVVRRVAVRRRPNARLRYVDARRVAASR